MKSETPTRYFAKQVKNYRRLKEWTQPELADRCQAAGLDWDRSIIANVEGNRRSSITVHEVFALAHVFSVPPAALLFPVKSGQPVEVADGLALHPGLALRWFVGDDGPFGPDADRVLFTREAQPLVLYTQLGRQSELAVNAALNTRAQEAVYGTDSSEAIAARKAYAAALEELAQSMRNMENIGMLLPAIAPDLFEDAALYGVQLPESVTKIGEGSRGGR
jgi:transcriptional regulator with XRE-family HTH domain